ncbi:hypothetical protein CORC01_13442 [Colletotrichum orchidophilum]|uniref:Uncharacterized protein n=1 Tax=Colletotrichum orchidophilum TaxID=1209926 RepID=A0A1G4AQE5_9PEZI|nr:uncharacterized protein CORC01_13442 [Colletotrichum orchidophilum]OHE91242.1 hypothetical protein CORC01_13442 [Colletotrichum orchidophilum]
MYLKMRIPLGLASSSQNGPPATLQRREEMDGKKITTIVILAVLVFLIFIAFVIFSLRASRRSTRGNNKKPRGGGGGGGFFKSILKNGAGRNRYRQAQDVDSTSTERLTDRRRSRPSSVAFDASADQSQADARSPNSAVNRNTSIRSIMTLPAYRPDPNETEQVLGREGERGGVDVVIEYPTEETEEGLRDQEMEALYQIRLARRQELAEREERRLERRDARERGDFVALDNIRLRAQTATNNSVVAALREEHERLKNERQRAVSSVSYADLGVARHDGTRLRANSNESERMGLLSDSASIAATSIRSGAESATNHRRGSSVMSIESDLPSPGFTARTRANSRPDTPRLDTRSGSSPEVVEADVGDAGMPIYSPPGYDEVSLNDERSRSNTPQPGTEPPPTYPGPAQQRAESIASSMADLAADEQTANGSADQRRHSGVPRLPSLRLQQVPSIVIEPSSARPHDDR